MVGNRYSRKSIRPISDTDALKQKNRTILRIRLFVGFSLYFMTPNIIRTFRVQVISYTHLRFMFRKPVYHITMYQ